MVQLGSVLNKVNGSKGGSWGCHHVTVAYCSLRAEMEMSTQIDMSAQNRAASFLSFWVRTDKQWGTYSLEVFVMHKLECDGPDLKLQQSGSEFVFSPSLSLLWVREIKSSAEQMSPN